MTPVEFNHSVTVDAQPSSGLPPALCALWWLARGDWNRAHAVAQDDGSAAGSWVHAHLHRVEGDEGNAGYWYARAARTPTSIPLEAERAAIIEALLERGG